jgi:hypothetical protein
MHGQILPCGNVLEVLRSWIQEKYIQKSAERLRLQREKKQSFPSFSSLVSDDDQHDLRTTYTYVAPLRPFILFRNGWFLEEVSVFNAVWNRQITSINQKLLLEAQ